MKKMILTGIFAFLFIIKNSNAQDPSLPIGVFDSGTGGLTILNTIIQYKDLSKEKYIYLADQANMPYGNYHAENKDDFLVELVMKDVEFLRSKKVKTIVIACNTATAYGFEKVQEYLKKEGIDLKVIGVIDAGAKGVLDIFQKNENGSIGVFATAGTVASKGYEKTILRLKDQLSYKGNIQVYSQGGYGLAEAVDGEPDFINRSATAPTGSYRGPAFNGAQYKIDKTLLDIYHFDFDENKMLCDNKNTDECEVLQINSSDNYVRYHLVSLMENIRKTPGSLPLKALVLGCTHYPYLKKEITATLADLYNYNKNGKYIYRAFMQKDIQLIDPAENVAVELYNYLKKGNLFSAAADTTVSEFYITVPDTQNKHVQLDAAGRFTYDFKYGRQTGQQESFVKTVPFNTVNISEESYERFRDIIPSTYRLINTYQKKMAVKTAAPAIDNLYKYYADSLHSPGMVYAIVANGKILHSGNIGYSNVEKKYLASSTSAFRVASMTKSLVSMAILQLRDKGKLRLDDPAYLYIPELKNQQYLSADAPAMTLRNMLTHSAGFPEDNPWGDRQMGITNQQMLDMFKKGIQFSNVPAINYEYSNMGFAILGYIIEKVSGKSYEEYINQNILQPLGMKNTYWEYDKVDEKNLALGYRYVNDKWVAQPLLHDGAYGAMGGLITTIEDFNKYVSFHLSAWPPSDDKEIGPLKRSSVREMDGPRQMGPLNARYTYPGGRFCPTISAYGYGIRWVKDCEGRITIGHSGGLPGYGSNWMILPDYGIGVITFSNVTYSPATMINNHILDTLLTISGIQPNKIRVSDILNQRKDQLIQLLPNWNNAEQSGIFADNFFLDYFTDSLKKDAIAIFNNAGKLVKVHELVPVNNLRGTFMMEGEKGNIEIWFTLTPENPPLIQEYHITFHPKSSSDKVNAFNYSPVKDIRSFNGAVVSAHTLASEVGINILKQGGNAIDAAIATQLALAVVYPNAGNIGGGGFLVSRLKNNQIIALDYREKAPSASSRDMYLDSTGVPVLQKSVRGAPSNGVPGTIAGIFESMKYAKLPFEQLIDPAIALAEKGFIITERDADAFNKMKPDFERFNTITPVFIRSSPWKKGDTLIQTDLANTLKRIKKDGAKGFYEGETAKLIVEEMTRGGGYINYDDLKNYRAIWRDPHTFQYKGHTIISMPPPSSGGILINQMLKMIEERNIEEYGPLSAQSVQLMTEVERRSYADRARYMGDPDFFKVPVKEITDSLYLVNRMKKYKTRKSGSSGKIKPGKVNGYESEETTHISIIDKEGNAVAVTTTLNDSYGSSTVVGHAGFLLNDEMDDFSVKPGAPNMYGAIGGEANSIQPGKRMLSSMTPTIVLKDNKPFIITGTPGGTTIPTSVFQTLVNIIDFKLSPREAIDLAKFHHQWLPDWIYTESGFPQAVIQTLTKKGYLFKEREAIGRTEVIMVRPDGSFEAAADKRGDDSASGF